MTDVWDGIASEFLHPYPSGARLLAVAGTDAERARHAADALAAALASAGQRVDRAHTADGDEQALRADVIDPFRAERPSGTVLLASGPAALLSESARGIWNFSVWLVAEDEAPHAAASALVDIADPAHPRRRWADSC